MKYIFMILSFIVLVVPAFAVVGQGQNIPHSLAALDQNGVQQNFETIKGEKGAVLVFVRSLDWCPFCQNQLLELQGIADVVIQDHGYNIVSVSYDTPKKLKKFSEQRKSPFISLSDPNSDIIKAFGILNDTYEEDSRFYGIPHPHVYVVNADGVIQHVLSEEGYRLRPSNEQILEAIARDL